MSKRLRRFFLTLSLLMVAFKVLPQISCTPTAGCVPLVGVSFTGAPGATGILWNFGDATSSNINNPTHTYPSSGTYTVTYNATVSSSPVTYTLLVKVFPKPVANFSFTLPSNHCAPVNVAFTDLSVGGGTTSIVNWQWAFGDGGLSGTQNPNYSYTIPGTFSITLIVKDANGCDSTITKSAVPVSAQPTVVISSNPLSLSSCTVPFTASFSGSNCASGAPGGGPLTYSWNFGNTQTSTVQNPPSVTYTTQGVYTVSLTVTDNNSCSKTVTTPVTLIQPQVKVHHPDTVCLGSLAMFRDSSLATSSTWNFGDASPPYGFNLTPPATSTLSHLYSSPGSYTVSVTATSGLCTQTKTFTVYVEKVTANFVASAPSFTCSKTFPATFTSTSTNSSGGSLNYSWNFPNGSSSTLSSPTTTLTQGSLNPFTIFGTYKPRIHLTVTSSFGCKDTISFVYDSIRRITAYFWDDKSEGCVPLTVSFHDSSFSAAPIVTHDWNFGDGNTTSGPTATLVVHTYTAVGTYSVIETISNSNGCIDTSFVRWIKVRNPAPVNFTVSPTTVCPNQPVTVTMGVNPADSVNHWHVDSDLGMFSSCFTNSVMSSTFNHTGTFGFTVSAYADGCESSAVSATSVTVKGPIASGRFFTRCDSTYKITFHALLQDAQYGVWNYGDASPTQTLSGMGSFTTAHTYSASGNYTASLTAYNSTTGCPPSTFTTVVTVRKVKAAFLDNSVSCKKTASTYTATATDAMTACNTGYTWLFGNYPPVQTSFAITNYTFTTAGIYTIHLIVKDTNDCRDTATKVIKVSSVTANFAASPTVGCLPSFTVTTNNASTSDTSAVSYSWNFGDGSGIVSGNNPSHTYTSIATPPSQIDTITMIATNGYGCKDTIKKVVQINTQLPVLTSLGSPSICVNSPIIFQALNVPGVVSYTWNPGNSSAPFTNTNSTTAYSYTAAGTYTASVIVQDAAGCQGKSTYPVYVQNYPIPSFTFINQCNTSSSVACAGCTILFQDNSTNPFPGPRNWDLATGGPIVGTSTVGTAYTTPGTYVITLTVTSSYGCAAIKKDTITVYGATADFITDKNTVCKGEAITFTIKDTSNVFTWHWDFGDGSDAGKVSPTAHSYTFHPPSGTTNASLIYWTSDSACKYSVVKPINIRNIIADFDRNNEMVKKDSIHCLGVQDLFTSTSTSATAWSWNFGDGGNSSMTNPTHTYANPGTYTVTLAISDTQYGCKDTIRKPMWIITPPVATLGGRDTCAGAPTQLLATGQPSYTYVWHPGTHLSDSTVANPIATLTVPTVFTVEITDPNGCTNTVTKSLYIQQPPKSMNWDTSVVIGQPVTIPGYAGSNFTYTWNPITDLSCTNCPYPISTTTVDMTYTANIQDNMGCFKTTNTFSIHIEPLSSVDVPTAFTPNGDGINDIIYVDGWGIKKLNYFRVYNRWGQLLFESNDIKIGWDGFFNGAPQNMETYVYQVSVETYIDAEPKLKAGTFKLIR